MRLKDKKAIVTGAASGIGREIARLFAAEGARVLATDIDQAGLNETCTGSKNTNLLIMDVGDSESVEESFASACATLDGLDILVCAAGVVGSKYGDGPAGECLEQGWDHVMNVNLKGVWRCCRYAIPAMLESSGGSIITLSSVTAICPPAEFFRSHAYMTSKGGVITLTKCIAAYYGRQGIRANAIAPGMIDTPMSKRMQGIPQIMAYLEDRQLLGQLGTPLDLAAAALFLGSDESRFISGTVLPVDGGWSNHG
jgi:NAD(P)-dependent dehydrogenase (short-subunit alcohol dehydrogenase family)